MSKTITAAAASTVFITPSPSIPLFSQSHFHFLLFSTLSIFHKIICKLEYSQNNPCPSPKGEMCPDVICSMGPWPVSSSCTHCPMIATYKNEEREGGREGGSEGELVSKLVIQSKREGRRRGGREKERKRRA